MLNCISETVKVIEGRILASPDLKVYLNNSTEDKQIKLQDHQA